jgi:hypothetical protein
VLYYATNQSIVSFAGVAYGKEPPVKKRGLQSGSRAPNDERVELEFVINELAADQAAVRIVLQSFLMRLLAVRAETAPAAFAELQDHVLRSIAAIPLAPDDEVGAARWKKLVAASAGKLLGEISDTLDLPAGKRERAS